MLLGVLVGGRVGTFVGVPVGAFTGGAVGPAVTGLDVGAPDGAPVGRAVGAPVGGAVGWRVGTPVGGAVGTPVGGVVGAVTGCPVGTAVGGEVGCCVGVLGVNDPLQISMALIVGFSISGDSVMVSAPSLTSACTSNMSGFRKPATEKRSRLFAMRLPSTDTSKTRSPAPAVPVKSSAKCSRTK